MTTEDCNTMEEERLKTATEPDQNTLKGDLAWFEQRNRDLSEENDRLRQDVETLREAIKEVTGLRYSLRCLSPVAVRVLTAALAATESKEEA